MLLSTHVKARCCSIRVIQVPQKVSSLELSSRQSSLLSDLQTNETLSQRTRWTVSEELCFRSTFSLHMRAEEEQTAGFLRTSLCSVNTWSFHARFLPASTTLSPCVLSNSVSSHVFSYEEPFPDCHCPIQSQQPPTATPQQN